MLTFRTNIIVAVMTFITALGAILIAIQLRTFHLAASEAASAYMDAASAKAFGRLQSEVSEVASVVRVLSTSSSVANSDERTEVDRVIPLFKTALRELPQVESIYVGYDNGTWLQVRPLGMQTDEQRNMLGASRNAAFLINLINPLPDGELPLRRIFENEQGDKIEQIDLWRYGYDARQRSWYRDTLAADRTLISAPYLAFTNGAPVITVSTPVRGNVRGVIAANLKLDDFSNFVYAQRPGEHGTALIFTAAGALIAYPDLAQFVASAMTHPSRSRMPNISDIKGGAVAAVLKGWDGEDHYQGSLRDEGGSDYLFRLRTFSLADQFEVKILLLAAQDDFVAAVRKVQVIGIILSLLACAAFIPGVWFFGGRMSRSLGEMTAQARKLQMLAAPDGLPVSSRIKEMYDLGIAVDLAQRAIWSFAHFVSKEIVRGIIDKSISTELGGVRQEIALVFTDVRDFTTIAEASEPDTLMLQTSRYFAALTGVFLSEGGTVDKYIGDAVMVFWNAPKPQPDHVERACRAALSARTAAERLNCQFEAEGLPPFVTRFGIHVGEAVVGNVGSTERMDYTALGNTVNLASRLEGLNKEYGTTILVSENVHSRIQHSFRLRLVNSVIAKGMTKCTRIYELIEARTRRKI